MNDFPACVSDPQVHAWYPQKSAACIRFPGNGVTDGYEPPYACWEPNQSPLQNQPVLLTTHHLSRSTELFHREFNGSVSDSVINSSYSNGTPRKQDLEFIENRRLEENQVTEILSLLWQQHHSWGQGVTDHRHSVTAEEKEFLSMKTRDNKYLRRWKNGPGTFEKNWKGFVSLKSKKTPYLIQNLQMHPPQAECSASMRRQGKLSMVRSDNFHRALEDTLVTGLARHHSGHVVYRV